MQTRRRANASSFRSAALRSRTSSERDAITTSAAATPAARQSSSQAAWTVVTFSRPSSAACRRSRSSMPAEKSRPTTSWPARASGSASAPEPQPTSSTLSPGRARRCSMKPATYGDASSPPRKWRARRSQNAASWAALRRSLSRIHSAFQSLSPCDTCSPPPAATINVPDDTLAPEVQSEALPGRAPGRQGGSTHASSSHHQGQARGRRGGAGGGPPRAGDGALGMGRTHPPRPGHPVAARRRIRPGVGQLRLPRQ